MYLLDTVLIQLFANAAIELVRTSPMYYLASAFYALGGLIFGYLTLKLLKVG